MGFSFVGLIVSKVLPSTPFTNSLLMKLQSGRCISTWLPCSSMDSNDAIEYELFSYDDGAHLQSSGLGIFPLRSLKFD